VRFFEACSEKLHERLKALHLQTEYSIDLKIALLGKKQQLLNSANQGFKLKDQIEAAKARLAEQE
jgi:hypothetical protein